MFGFHATQVISAYTSKKYTTMRRRHLAHFHETDSYIFNMRTEIVTFCDQTYMYYICSGFCSMPMNC